MRKFVFNNERQKFTRTILRKRSTNTEKTLWNYLRNRKLGVKFYRQYSIGPFIVDFCCPSQKIVIEIDGSQHEKFDHKGYDQNRSEYIKLHRLRVIRFWNSEIEEDLARVLDQIKKYLNPLP